MTDEVTVPIEVAPQDLSPGALQGVVEAFILREGTDYGAREYSLPDKVAHVMRQLERGEARIMFDPGTETVQILPAAGRRPAQR